MKHAALAVLSVLLLALNGPGVSAQTARTIRIVVPFPPGGPSDTTSRLVAEEIARAQSLTTIIENRPGAGAVIGTEAAARAAPDGNTLLHMANSFIISPHLKKLSYDPLTSFEPICLMVRSPHFFVVHSSSPYRTLAEWIAAARARPGELTLATVGPATGPHIAFERLKRAANVNITFVPFNGTAPSVNALLGGHVTSAVGDFRDVVGLIKSGALRGLATASRARISALPDIPTVAESGYRDYDQEGWFGWVAPARTPKESIEQLAGWVTAALKEPKVSAKLVDLGLFPDPVCGAPFGAHLRKQYEGYEQIIREANIKAE